MRKISTEVLQAVNLYVIMCFTFYLLLLTFQAEKCSLRAYFQSNYKLSAVLSTTWENVLSKCQILKTNEPRIRKSQFLEILKEVFPGLLHDKSKISLIV